jgi:hypothetical protein
MGSEYFLVSGDAQRALEEFAMDFAMALAQGPVDPWAKTNGVYKQVGAASKLTFPVPVSAAGYEELKGDLKYRDLFEKSFSFTPKTWQDGVSALASVIEAPDFIGWTSEPGAMAQAALSLPNEIIAGLLESNPTCWDDVTFFHASHPVNVFDSSFGTFDNDITGAGTNLSSGNLALAKQYFREIKAANGKPLGLRMTHLLVPAALEETARDILERDLIIESNGANDFGTVNNRHKGTVKLVVSDDFTSDIVWYPLALGKPGMFPWIVQDEGAPEEIRSDKDSHLYKTTLKVAVAYVLRGNGALALPQCVQRWAGTAP